jgi:hypothetical protein
MIARALMLAVCVAALSAAALADNVVTYHNSLTRNGDYELPDLTLAAAANMHPDTAFNGTVSGNVYAQPLFWHPSGGNAEVIVATESNIVYALDATTGAVTWQTTLAAPASLGQLPCGNINPDGTTGTPVIDPAAGVLYLDALTKGKSAPEHLIYALSLTDGSVVSGWPLNVHKELKKLKIEFSDSTQGERSALLLFGKSLYVNYGGNYGDCGSYRGSVVEVNPSTQKITAAWQTKANGGGIWAQGGVSGDGKSVFATTGNTIGAANWSGGEAIVRLNPGLAYSKKPKDFFAPSNWQTLDDEDQDLGGTEALPFDIAVSGGAAAQRVIAFGKDGNAYLVDRKNLGGIGGALAVTNVSNSQIITAPAILSTQSASMVAFTNSGGGNCSGGSITMLNVAASGSSPISVAWCAALNGRGAPIITTTDGSSNAIVWAVGAEGDNELHGFNAQTGAVVFSGSGTGMSNLHHFVTILAAEDHFYVASDNKIYAFAFQ